MPVTPGCQGGANLGRLLDFAEPAADDVCLDVTYGGGPLAVAMRSRVRHMTTVDVDSGPASASPLVLPYRDGMFTLVIARVPLCRLADPPAAVREMLRVCHPPGRLIIADQIRTDSAMAGSDRPDLIERLRDPAYTGTPSVAHLTDLLTGAGADMRRLDVFTIERPAEPWLADTCDEDTAKQIRTALMDEVDGGPSTGARPRLIGGELWFTQRWAHIAAGHGRPPGRTPDPYGGGHAGMGSAHPGADGDPAAPPRRAGGSGSRAR